MEERVLIFSINFRYNKGFKEISQFITKLETKDELTDEEVENVRYKAYKLDKYYDNKYIAELIQNDNKNYKKIENANMVSNIEDKFIIIYCIQINEKEIKDIVDLQYMYLLIKYFDKCRIMSIIHYDKQEIYHKISHYYLSINIENTDFYNKIYCEQNNQLKRLQINKVGALGSFLPLQEINENTYRKLFISIYDVVDKELIHETIFETKIRDIKNELVYGVLKLLNANKKVLNHINADNIDSIFNNVNYFTFTLFCFSIKDIYNKKRSLKDGKNNILLTSDEIKQYLYQLATYVDGCQQLIENIIFHSEAKFGCLSFRVHSKNEEYLYNHYEVEKNDFELPFLEIMISDYAGINNKGNISQNFIRKLDTEDKRVLFKSFTPSDFFVSVSNDDTSHNQDIKNAWLNYYLDVKNITKHFGLRIFNRIVLKNGGMFTMESHTNHICEIGECYSGAKNHWNKRCGEKCLPGTYYSIVFPLKKLQLSLMRQDTSIDENSYNKENIEKHLSIISINQAMEQKVIEYKTQLEKEKIIYSIVMELQGYIQNAKNKKADIMYLSMDGFDENYGELLCRAIFSLNYIEYNSPNYVLYECSDSLLTRFLETAQVGIEDNEIQSILRGNDFQIALFSKKLFDMAIVVPNNRKLTISINKWISLTRGVPPLWKNVFESNDEKINIFEAKRNYVPYDILHRVIIDGEERNLFGHYVHSVLEKNIQEKAFGTKICSTHMRLGSTIHIDNFYEAELLFGNQLFVSRFAFGLIKEMWKDIQNIDKITLYGYAIYSELLLFEMMTILKTISPQMDVDYAILEREAEHRELAHIDRIRYIKSFKTKSEQENYFADRKLVCIVPINSTLKTHEKLINLFLKENIGYSKENIIKNYAIIVVGSKEGNDYWILNPKTQTLISSYIKPDPCYFVDVKLKYEEPLKCSMCFPDNPIAEIPLIEVNATSTIPNQSFGIKSDVKINDIIIDYEKDISQEEKKLKPLYNSLIYRHTKRGENHYLYYFKTEILFIEYNAEINKWLRIQREKIIKNENEYNIIFSPIHFSDAGFVECINKEVFDEAAYIIRADVDKEFRNNIQAKYSNLKYFVKQLSIINEDIIIKIHFVDDSIITGRTFFRSKSLVQSIFECYANEINNIQVRVFDKIFVLLDRNSNSSKKQYVQCWENQYKDNKNWQDNYFFSYINLTISSLRNHGDSCIICNLEKEAKILYRNSSIKAVSDYWKEEEKKFGIQPLTDKILNDKIINEQERLIKEEEKRQRNFRRMVCTHIASKKLCDKLHNNQSELAIIYILKICHEDFKNRRESDEKFEYFLSYLKVISRPFLSFHKAIREAIFDILLIFMEMLITNKSVNKIIESIKGEKPYLNNMEIINNFRLIQKDIIRNKAKMTDEIKLDLLKVLIKQLAELKSNYIIRAEKMNQLFEFFNNLKLSNKVEIEKEFREYYLASIKKLVGVSSDTSKCVWFDYVLHHNKEKNCTNKYNLDIPKEFKERLFIENTRAFRDGIDKLCISDTIQFNDDEYKYLCETNKNEVLYYSCKQFIENGFNDDYEKEIDDFLKITLNEETIVSYETIHELRKKWNAKRALNYVYERALNEKEKNDIKKIRESIKKRIQKYIADDNYQFKNFIDILNDYKFVTISENERDKILISLSNEGALSIASCIILSQKLLNEQKEWSNVSDVKTEKQLNIIANLLNRIFQSYQIQFVMERPSRVESWKTESKQKFNKIINDYNEVEHNYDKISYIEEYETCEYLVLADSMEGSSTRPLNFHVIERLNEYKKNYNKDGMLINYNDKYIIWEISQQSKHTIIVYAEFNILNGYEELNHIRNAMMFYYLFEATIFNQLTNNYLHELIVARSEVQISNFYKVHSHTQMETRLSQYDDVTKDSKCEEYYRSHILTLLSDLKISEIYRNSLKNEYYLKKRKMGFVQWDSSTSIFNKEIIFYANKLKVVINNTPLLNNDITLNKEDSLISYMQERDAHSTVFLLILSLVLNVAKDDRGKSVDGKVEVYLSKTSNHTLRILNEIGTVKVDTEAINEEINSLPESAEKGISLWSASRYIKGFIGSIIYSCIEDTKIKMKNCKDNKDMKLLLTQRKEIIEKLLSDDFNLKVNKVDHKYFSLEIPILVSKYEEFQEFFNNGY